MQGIPLARSLASQAPLREGMLYGLNGGHVDVTDGRYTYMRAPARPENHPLYDYTLMPTHMRHTFGIDELQDIQLAEPFSFTKGCRMIKIAAGHNGWRHVHRFGTLLFDLHTDRGQEQPIHNPEVERRMIALLIALMEENDAPPEQFERLGLNEYR
jgi:hypothetical protein